MNTWKHLAFDPPLSEAKRRLLDEELACRGFKVWLLARGIPANFSGCSDGRGFGMLWAEEVYDDGAVLLVAYGNDADEMYLDDADGLETALHAFVPDAETEVTAGQFDHIATEFLAERQDDLR